MRSQTKRYAWRRGVKKGKGQRESRVKGQTGARLTSPGLGKWCSLCPRVADHIPSENTQAKILGQRILLRQLGLNVMRRELGTSTEGATDLWTPTLSRVSGQVTWA